MVRVTLGVVFQKGFPDHITQKLIDVYPSKNDQTVQARGCVKPLYCRVFVPNHKQTTCDVIQQVSVDSVEEASQNDVVILLDW